MGKSNFTEGFKRDAVAQIVERGYLAVEVSQRLGVSQHSLYGRKKKFSKAAVSYEDYREAEIRRLKRELARLTEERNILKKRPRISARMQSEIRVCGCACSQFSVRTMCRCLRIHPSGFYTWRNMPLGKRALEDARQAELIRKSWKDSGKVYGYRKLHDDLIEQGETCCPNRVSRLAKLAGIKGQIGYRRRPGQYGSKPSLIVDNTLDRQFDVQIQDRALVTYNLYPNARGLFLFSGRYRPLLPLRYRLVHAKSPDDRCSLISFVDDCVASEAKGEVLIHSDQGSQFTSIDWASFWGS